MQSTALVCVFTLGLVVETRGQANVTIAADLLPGAVEGTRGPYLVRLVDDFTGEPIAGAEVFLVDERAAPIAGEFWFEHRGVSDADGFVRIARPDSHRGSHWQVMRHPQRGVAVRAGAEPIWRIGQSYDVPLEIQDWAGRPAAGAYVGFCGGCGHTPDVASATADANGFAILRGVDPQQDISDLYVQHPGLHIYYDSVGWRPGEPPFVVRCGYSRPQTGRVLDHRGEPVAGAFVCGGGWHRGPWARTAADGSFTVLGAGAGDAVHRVRMPDGRDVWVAVDGEDPYPVTIQLPDLADPKAYEATVEVAQAPPRTPPKTRSVRVIVENAPADVVCRVEYPEQPTGGAESADRIDAPVGAPFVLRVFEEGEPSCDRTFPFADGATVPDPLVVRWPADPLIRGRCVGADREPRACRVRWRRRWSEDDEKGPWLDGAATFAIASDIERGWRLLEIEADVADRRIVWVLVPGFDGVVDLGDVVVGGEPQLVVRSADPSWKVGFARPGFQEAGEPLVWPLASDGSWRGPDLRAGDAIVVERGDAAVPFRTVLQGDGPWTLVPPDGALDLEVVGADGAGIGSGVVVGDHFVAAKDGRFALRGLRPGAMRLWIGAPGHRSAFVDVEIGATAAARVALPPR